MTPQDLFNQTYVQALNELFQGDQAKVAYTLQVKQAKNVISEAGDSAVNFLRKITGTRKDPVGFPGYMADLNAGTRTGLAAGAAVTTPIAGLAGYALGKPADDASESDPANDPAIRAILQKYGIGAGEGALGGLAGGALAGDRSLGALGISSAAGGLGGAGGTAAADVEAVQELAAQAGISPAQLGHILSSVLGVGAGAAASKIRQALA